MRCATWAVLVGTWLGGCAFEPEVTLRDFDAAALPDRLDEESSGCGNGILESGEQCDGSDLGTETCASLGFREGSLACTGDCRYDTSGCVPMSCGDGHRDPPEECDDGNLEAGDGCSPTCRVEAGWACTESGGVSVCRTVCGDGLVAGSEECDDGNAEPGDGCSADCLVEDHFACWDEPSRCVCRVFVDGRNTAGSQDGTSWASAFVDLAAGIEEAARLRENLNVAVCQVWVAQGRYCPYVQVPEDAFFLRAGVALLGGFCGNEASPAERPRPLLETCRTSLDATDVSGSRVYRLLVAKEAGDATVEGIEVLGADGWGGAAVSGGARFFVRHCLFRDNFSRSPGGGGLRVEGGFADVEDATFLGNRAYEADGGGAWVAQGASARFVRTLFLGNRATYWMVGSAPGGGLAVVGSAELRDVVFLANEAVSDGAGLQVSGGTVDGTGCLFEANVASGNGGGVAVLAGAQVALADTRFVRNRAEKGGAATVGSWGQDTRLVLDRCVFDGNHSDGYGGALHLWSSDWNGPARGLVSNSLFVHNEEADGWSSGAVAHCENSQLEVVSSTAADNQATGTPGDMPPAVAGILAGTGCRVTLRASIFWNEDGAELYDDGAAHIAVADSDLQDSLTVADETSGRNISEDPLFVDQQSGNYHLAAGSPCLDTADDTEAGPLDLDGNERVVDLPGVGNDGSSVLDMGCYEHQ